MLKQQTEKSRQPIYIRRQIRPREKILKKRQRQTRPNLSISFSKTGLQDREQQARSKALEVIRFINNGNRWLPIIAAYYSAQTVFHLHFPCLPDSLNLYQVILLYVSSHSPKLHSRTRLSLYLVQFCISHRLYLRLCSVNEYILLQTKTTRRYHFPPTVMAII